MKVVKMRMRACRVLMPVSHVQPRDRVGALVEIIKAAAVELAHRGHEEVATAVVAQLEDLEK